MKVVTFSEARQKFAAVLDCAQNEGEVRVTRRDGRVFTIRPVKPVLSPLAVKGIDLKLSEKEILDFIKESRRI